MSIWSNGVVTGLPKADAVWMSEHDMIKHGGTLQELATQGT